MAPPLAAHARRGDRITEWWRGVSLRAKVTGVTVAVLAIEAVRRGPFGVRSLQEFDAARHAVVTGGDPAALAEVIA